MAQKRSNGSGTNSVQVLLVEDNPGDVELTQRLTHCPTQHKQSNLRGGGLLAKSNFILRL
ncbi:hypothetical protein KFU94_65455 [Chloroflexi bacterium TSY]|nr:hypothetical protein [Chloroflexi bacterium TSY]